MDTPTSRSHRLVQSRTSSTEARAYLQARMEVFSRLMFWAFVALLAFLAAMYWVYPEITPQHNEAIFIGAMVGLSTMAIVWRILIVRRSLSIEGLYRVDLIYATFIGLAFGGSAYFAFDFRPAGYASLIYASFMVFTRTIVVPSTARRTLVVSIIVFVPVIAAGLALGITTKQDLPGPAYVFGGFVFAVVAILLATVGSSTIYELRQKVSTSMQLGQYTLDKQIGKGGMGTVYRAHHALLRRPTALKLMQPDRIGAEDQERFEREVQHMSALTHPNIVAVYDYGVSLDGVLYYAMELLDGIDLDKLVKLHGRQRPGRVAKILGQVAGALAEAHGAGIVHRDVKPANIILCERGGAPDVAKVVDFGLVALVKDKASADGTTIMGTPAYLAPEAVTPPMTIGPPADLYALGAVGYYLLTGRAVFEGDRAEVIVKHVAATPTPPSELFPEANIPAALEAIILRCLAKEPSERLGALELVEAFAQIPTTDWPDREARAWWAEFHAKKARIDAASAAVTETITVQVRSA